MALIWSVKDDKIPARLDYAEKRELADQHYIVLMGLFRLSMLMSLT